MASTSQGLLSTYRKYKVDTETVAGWLVTTATKHGFKFGDRVRCAVRTRDIVPMAEFIAAGFKKGGKGQFTLNPAVDAAFRRAIAARKRVTAWYETTSHGELDVEESNGRHHYFTNILLKAWNVLLDAAASCSSKLPPTTQPKGAAKVSSNTNNRFTALTLEDIDDDGGDIILEAMKPTHKAKKTKEPSSSAVPDVFIVGDDQQIEDEFWFAIQSFLMELHKVRDIILRYWEDYNASKIDLIMAALGTRTAIDLIRRAEIELGLRIIRPRRFPEDKYPVWKLPALLYAREHSTAGQDLDSFLNVEVDNYKTVPDDQNDFCLYNIYVLFTCHAKWGSWMSSRPQGSPIWPLGAAKDPLHFVDLNLMMLRLRLIVSPEWQMIPWEDEVSRGLRHVLQQGEVVIWAMFAFKVLWDTHKLDHKQYAYHDIFEEIGEVIDSSNFTTSQLLDSKWAYDSDIAQMPSADGHDALEFTLARVGAWVYGNESFHGLATHLRRILWPAFFLEMNPLHCGLIKYDLYRSRHWAIWRMNNTRDMSLWTLMHIYVAGRIAFPESAAWPDMEFFIHLQDVSQLFIGGRPRTLPECAKKWLLAQGNTISEVNRGSWDSLKRFQGCIDDKKWRPMGDNSMFGYFFATRLHACDKHSVAAHDNFKDQIQKMHSRPALSRLAAQLNIDKDKKQEFVDTWEKRLHSWTISDILELTQKYLSVDTADVGFNYHGLHDTCASMWDKVAPLMRESTEVRGRNGCLSSTTVILCDVAEADRCARKKKIPLAKELEESVPAFTELWKLIQTLTDTQDDKLLADGRLCYAAERSLSELLVMNGEMLVPGTVVAPHLEKCFAGWPADRGTARVLAQQCLQRQAGALPPPERRPAPNTPLCECVKDGSNPLGAVRCGSRGFRSGGLLVAAHTGLKQRTEELAALERARSKAAAMETDETKTTLLKPVTLKFPTPETTPSKAMIPKPTAPATPPKTSPPKTDTKREEADAFQHFLQTAGPKFWA